MEENIKFPLPLTLQPKTVGKEERENIQGHGRNSISLIKLPSHLNKTSKMLISTTLVCYVHSSTLEPEFP